MESGEPSSMNSMPGDCYHLQGMKFLTAAPLIEALHENVTLILEALRKTGVAENRLTVNCFSRCFRSIYGGPQHHFLSVRDIKGFWTSHSSEITSHQLGIPCFLSIFARHQHTSHPPVPLIAQWRADVASASPVHPTWCPKHPWPDVPENNGCSRICWWEEGGKSFIPNGW